MKHINDMKDPTATYIKLDNGKYKRLNTNHSYDCWKGIFTRIKHNKKDCYIDCFVCDEWYTRSNFHRWYIEQEKLQGDLSGLVLDKDLLIPNNKVYCPEACLFIPQWLNVLLLERTRDRGQYPLGVCKYKNGFTSSIGNGSGVTKTYLGFYSTPEEAHRVWQQAKINSIQEAIARLEQERILGDNTYKATDRLLQVINQLQNDIDNKVVTTTFK